MDETEHFTLSSLPTQALKLRLARSAIRMNHAPTWRINKINPVHDLVICLTGAARYEIAPDDVTLSPGEALLIPAGQRFRGHHLSGDSYTGVAQHFTLELFGRGDILQQMNLRRKVQLRNWQVLGPVVEHYRDTAPRDDTTLAQHHQFMVFLLSYLESAFIGWKDQTAEDMAGQDALSLLIVLTATRLSSNPLAPDALERALSTVPYNADYFRRAFRDRIGLTPQKFLESKRMEKAVHILGTGQTVKDTAFEVGYSDPFFFSRTFKRYIGASPSSYRLRGTDRTAIEYIE